MKAGDAAMPLNLLIQPESPLPAPPAPPAPPQHSDVPRQRRDLLADLLSDQQDLTAVERFARQHELGQVPAQAKHYRDLIPLSSPKAGQQYAFDVDLDACSGCKACVTACHNLNGLDDGETWRDVGMLVGGTVELPIIQHVTSACHHCLEPACLEGCPVNAYDKDPITGIVKHLDDQCIGCQYCIFKCPYDVPKFNKRLGIVRKCDMCSDRLDAGEAPACVQACPNQAIRITIVEQRKVVEDCEANQFVPGAAEPDYTLPTTNYRSGKVMPRNLLPIDHYTAAPQHAHGPLVAMLVLTQLSVGAFFIERLLQELSSSDTTLLAGGTAMQAMTALAVGVLALLASVLHLGRPLKAFRAIVGLRKSWLSREIVAFGLFAVAASVYATGRFLFSDDLGEAALSGVSTVVIALGSLGVLCSAMIYHDTRRAFWSLGQGGGKFLLTSIKLGVSTTLLVTTLDAALRVDGSVADAMRGTGRLLCLALAIVCGAKLLFEAAVLRHLADRQHTSQRKTARVLVGPLARVTVGRFVIGLLGGVVLPLLLALDAGNPVSHGALRLSLPAVIAVFILTLAGELMERYLFFAAAVPSKMPGGSLA